MGSLRNPIGPLPSSIYWRRRAVALALLALLVLLTLWALSLNAGKGGHDEGKGGGGPASSITPGPTESGPAITERPGGRDDSGGGGGSGSGAGSDSGSGSGSGGGSGGGPGGAGGGSGTPGGGGGSVWEAAGQAGGTGGGAAVPVGSELADCKGPGVTLALRSVHKEYAPGQKPRFELTATNERGTACKLDLGRTATVVTIKDSHDHKFWASDDCSRNAEPALFQLPANGTAVHTFTWYRKPSAADCGTPAKGPAKPGHYKIDVAVKGIKKAVASFALT